MIRDRRDRGGRTLGAEELARDVQGLAADDDDLLAVEELLGDDAGQAAEQVALAIDDNLWKRRRGQLMIPDPHGTAAALHALVNGGGRRNALLASPARLVGGPHAARWLVVCLLSPMPPGPSPRIVLPFHALAAPKGTLGMAVEGIPRPREERGGMDSQQARRKTSRRSCLHHRVSERRRKSEATPERKGRTSIDRTRRSPALSCWFPLPWVVVVFWSLGVMMLVAGRGELSARENPHNVSGADSARAPFGLSAGLPSEHVSLCGGRR